MDTLSLSKNTPAVIRGLAREGKLTRPTAEMAAGYAQANLVIL